MRPASLRITNNNINARIYNLIDFFKVMLASVSMYIRVPCFCYEGLPIVAFWRFYCINLVYEFISPLIDNTVQQATQMFIILLKTKKLRIVEDDIVNGLVQIPTRVQRP